MTDFQAVIFVVLVLAVWLGIAFLGAASGSCGDAGDVTQDEEDDFTIFSDMTDPSKSYLTYNIYHDDVAD
ncbi:MAG: hypothetical protein AB7E51_02480 [Pseudodesulfovibrio sp.]|uniref:hypothetical protein n=1 Tax=Pseudodesulfovibrio sp. TaxID=2035812 RepID=UPI003D0FD390